jgi:hypothetical protein
MVNLTYPKLLLIMLLMLPSFCFAQAVYNGQVLNKVTELAIPNVSVILLKEKTGTQTNTQGYFILATPDPLPNDTLVFSCVGYKTYRLPVSVYQKQMFVLLEAINTQLNEVTITNQKMRSETLSKFHIYDLKFVASPIYYHPTILVYSHTALAKLFSASKPDAILTEVSLGRQDLPETSTSFNTTNKYAQFLVHVMLQNPITGAPGAIIFTKTVSLTDDAIKIYIDLSKDNIVLHANNFFIAVEWLNKPYNEIIQISASSKLDRVTKSGDQIARAVSQYRMYYQPFLVGYPNESNTLPALLYKKVGNSWHVTHEYNPMEVALSATVHY